MSIKAVILDLDRTLLRSDLTISPYTQAVLRRCRARGIQVVAATARPLRAVLPFCELVSFDALVISNGARVICGERQIEQGMRRESADRVLQQLQAHPTLRVTLETGEEAYSNLPFEDYETILCADLLQVRGPVVKLIVEREGPETMTMVQTMLPEDLYLSLSHGHLIQILSRDVTKWNGICTLAELICCCPAEMAYFGDDHDDVEPLRRCGLGVAVANAIDEARAAADHIAASNDEDGAARFIEQFLLDNGGST